MKSFFTQLVLIAGLSVLAVSCGGSKGGGGSSANPYASNLSNVNLSATSSQALAEANAWYLNSVEGTAAQGNGGDVTRKKYVSSAPSSNCKPILGGLAQWCSSSSSTSSNNGTVVGQVVTVVFANTAGQVISAKGNVELNNVFSGSIGTLIEGRVLSANVITLTFLRTADNAVVTYTIDKSYHSLLNPVIVTEETQNSRSDTVVTYVRRF